MPKALLPIPSPPIPKPELPVFRTPRLPLANFFLDEEGFCSKLETSSVAGERAGGGVGAGVLGEELNKHILFIPLLL